MKVCEAGKRIKKVSKEAMFDSHIFGGGNTNDETDDISVVMLSAAHNLMKYDVSDAVDDPDWGQSDFGEALSEAEKLQLTILLQKHPEIFPTLTKKLCH